MEFKTKLFSFLLFAILLYGCQIDDATSPEPGETFVKYFGDDGVQAGSGLLYLEELDEIIVYGTQLTTDDGASRNVVFLRLDADGNEINKRIINFGQSEDNPVLTEGAGDDTPGALKYEPEVGFIYVGTSTRADTILGGTFNALVWAVLDDEFNIAGDSTYVGEVLPIIFTDDGDSVVSKFKDTQGNDVILSEGDLWVVGSSTLLQAGDEIDSDDDGEDDTNEDATQIYIAQIDYDAADSLRVLRERTRGFEGNDAGIYIDEFSDNSFVIIGNTEREAAEGVNVILLPTNRQLSPDDGLVVSWPIGATTNFNDIATHVFKRSSGYVVVGSSVFGGFNVTLGEIYPFFVNISYGGSGNAVAEQADTVSVLADVDGDGPETTTALATAGALGVTLGDNGNYFLVGTIPQYPGKNAEILVMQTNQQGTSISGSVRNYGLTLGNDVANDIVTLNDGSLLVLTTVDFGSGNTLMGLLKINSQGDLMD